MRIGIDVGPLASYGGVPRIVMSIIPRLEEIDRENEYYLYSDRDFVLPFENPRWHKRVRFLRPRFSHALWLQTIGKKLIVQDHPDLFWGTSHNLPLGLPPSMVKVLNTYDLVWRLYPETMRMRWYYMTRLFTGRSIRAADHILTISNSTRQGLIDLLGVPAEKTSVIYLAGVDARFIQRDRAEARAYVARKFEVSEDYILAVGTVEPRKNLPNLLRAFKLLRARDGIKAQLVVAGGKGWKKSELDATIREMAFAENEVKFLGWVPDEDLPWLYTGAAVFVYPSLYEGFGLPLVEAMACGVPIVTSNVSSMPEVVGDAALLVEPKHPEEISGAMARLYTDEGLRSRLIAKGLKRSQEFTWPEAARKLLNLFEKCTGLR
jgi:glycosyltransferase involved in cell wall biosynthesis